MTASSAPTGEQLYEELSRAAEAAGVGFSRFVEPIFPEPWKIEQLRMARRPTSLTIERVRALIEGGPIPPPRQNCAYARDPRAKGLTRAEAEASGIPPSGRSLGERHRLLLQMQAKESVEQLRALSEAAACSRRPGQTLHARLRELQEQEVAHAA